ncbi:MAG: IS630 family transposase [Candidatus Dormibacteria bacterium]
MAEPLAGHTLDRQVLGELRRRAVLAVESGESPEVVARVLGFHRSRIYDWLARYREGGLDALAVKPVPGRPPQLSEEQVGQLRQLLVSRDPASFGLPCELWTRAMVQQVVERELGVTLSAPSVSRLLGVMGLALQRLLDRARKEDPEGMERVIRLGYTEMRHRAARDRAILYFGDRAAWTTDGHRETAGTTVKGGAQRSGNESRVAGSVVTAVSAQGALRFMLTTSAFDTNAFVDFCRRLLHDAARPVYLVVDEDPAHETDEVRHLVRESGHRLHLLFLSAHARELDIRDWEWQLILGRT